MAAPFLASRFNGFAVFSFAVSMASPFLASRFNGCAVSRFAFQWLRRLTSLRASPFCGYAV